MSGHHPDVAALATIVGLIAGPVVGPSVHVATGISEKVIGAMITLVVGGVMKLVESRLRRREAREAADHAERVARASVPTGPPRMLAIDDDRAQHVVAAHVGEILGYAVEHATTAVGALDHLAADRGVSVILLDLLMPDGGPARVWARAVRAAAPPTCVIVVVSGDDRPEARATAEAIGAPFALKPANADQLADLIAATKKGK